jgi:hypothetical protein
MPYSKYQQASVEEEDEEESERARIREPVMLRLPIAHSLVSYFGSYPGREEIFSEYLRVKKSLTSISAAIFRKLSTQQPQHTAPPVYSTCRSSEVIRCYYDQPLCSPPQ